MAYGPSKTSARQTATNVAATLAAAGLTIEDVKENFESIRDYVYNDLQSVMAEEATAAPQRSYSSGGTSGGGSKGGSFNDPGSIELKFGAFKGMTIAQVAELSAGDAVDKTDGRYKKAGLEWLQWAANNKDPKAGFVQKAAEAFLDSRRA